MLAKGMVRNDKGWWLTHPSAVHWTNERNAEEEEALAASRRVT